MTAPAVERKTGWTADASTFGARLALIRQRMGWGNVEKAARACGISTETWRSWERDGREPHRLTTVAKQIAGVTGCDYLWLLLGPDRGEGGGDVQLNGRYNPLAERLIAPRSRATTQPKVRSAPRGTGPVSPVQPSRRRPAPVRSPNRVELAAA